MKKIKDAEKYGFVYIWYDSKRKKYYIGSHWGHEEDGYICSSRIMRKAFRRRPHNFKRRILEKTNDRKILLEIEDNWLKRVKRKERYYNLNFQTNNEWWHDDTRRTSATEKMIIGLKKYYSSLTDEERKQKCGAHHKGKSSWMKGKTHSEETRKKLREINLGRKYPNKKFKADFVVWNKGKTNCYSEITLEKMRNNKNGVGHKKSEEAKKMIGQKNKDNMNKLWSDKEYRRKQSESHIGHKLSEETKHTISSKLKGIKRSPENIEGMRLRNSGEGNPNYGKKWINNGTINKLWKDDELPEGFSLGRKLNAR